MSLNLRAGIITVIFSSALLTACGGGSGESSTTGPIPDIFAPTLSFDPTTLNIDSGETGTSTLTATDNVGIQASPTITCTEGGLYADSTFTAPVVSTETTSICSATATDAAGNSGVATLTVTVSPVPNQAPVANATINKSIISEEQAFILDASNSSDPEGMTLEYSWSQTDGPAVTLSDTSSPELTVISPSLESDAELVFELTVTDGEDESRDSVSIFVEAMDTLTIAGSAPQNTGNIYTSRIAGITAPTEGGFRTHWNAQSFTSISWTASQMFDEMMQRIGPETSATIRAITTPEVGILTHALKSGERTYYIHQTELWEQSLRRGFAIMSNRPEGEVDSFGVLIADGLDTDVFPVSLAASAFSDNRVITAIRVTGQDKPVQIDSYIHSPDGSQIKTPVIEPTTNTIRDVAVAQANDTDYLVTWSQATTDPDISLILGRLIIENGTQSQNVITIGDSLGQSYFPAMTTLTDGRILLVWNEAKDFAINQTLSIKGRILRSDGTFETDIFTIYTTEQSGDVLGLVRATAMQDGQALVTWWSDRREDTGGAIKVVETRIQSLAIGSDGEPVSHIFDIYHDQIATDTDSDVLDSFDDLQVAISSQNRALVGWNFRDFNTQQNSFYSDFYPVGR